MKQSRVMSLIESVVNILVGFGVACIAQAIFLPLLGVPIPLSANLAFAAIMTVISIARSYALRRAFEAFGVRVPISAFASAVLAERQRQITHEGWSPSHDDDLERGDLAKAGACYALFSGAPDCHESPIHWPWSREWWKPAGFRRDLVKAAALIVAEGERFDRQRKGRVDGSVRHFGLASHDPESKEAASALEAAMRKASA